MDFLSIAEVAQLSKQSQKTIRRHIAAGKLAAEKIGGRYRITKDSYNKWLTSDLDPEKQNIFSETIVNSESQDTVNWIDISDKWIYDGWANTNYRNGVNFIDLFSGAGGLSCGLVMAGFTPVGSVEIMPEAVATYEHNFLHNKGFKETVKVRDIRDDAVKKNLYNSIEDKHIHLIVGGFPCQGFSMAGHRVVTDPRNSLYLEMLEEEVDFSNGYIQDHRNWSPEFNARSGRLQISKTFIKDNSLPTEDISYEQTKNFISKMYNQKNQSFSVAGKRT